MHALGCTGHLVGEHRQLGYTVPPPEVSDQVLAAAGPHAWIVTTGVDFLRARRARYWLGDTALD